MQILSCANSNVIPQLFLGHTVHLVCASNGVIPDRHEEMQHAHMEPDDESFHSPPQHTLLVADTLDIALQVWAQCLALSPTVVRSFVTVVALFPCCVVQLCAFPCGLCLLLQCAV